MPKNKFLQVSSAAPPTAVLRVGTVPRVALVCDNGRQVAHFILSAVLATGVDYL